MPASVLSGALLAAGLQKDFANTLRKTFTGERDKLGWLTQLDLPIKTRTTTFGYYESPPHPQRVDSNTPFIMDNFKSRSYQVTTKKYKVGVGWKEEDREDEQLGKLVEQAKGAGMNFGLLHTRISMQILLGTVDPLLLDAIPDTPDGAALFSTTDGDGNDRFGITSGNLLTGTGMGSSAAVRKDFFNAVEQFKSFLDTKGQPLHAASLLEDYAFIYPVQHEQVVAEAFLQARTLDGGAALTNIVMESGNKVKFWSSPYLSGNSWFIVALQIPLKPITQGTRRALREIVVTMENSDKARETGQESVLYDARYTYHTNLPLQIIKNSNA